MSRGTKRVCILAVPGTDALDLAGPWSVFGHANDVLGRTAYELTLHGPRARTIPTRHGLLVGGVRGLPRAAARPPDIALVAGGSPLDPLPLPEQELARWLKRQAHRIRTLVSICTGAFVLGAAGLLDGKKVTTHWRFLGELQRRFPRARVLDEGIFVRHGPLWTSAGIAAGVDLSLALVEADHGHEVAMSVARNLVLFLRRSGNQAQFSAVLQRQTREPARLRDLSSFVLEHLHQELPVERVARGLGMSPRSLTRWCREHLEEAPAELVRRIRLEEARRLLEETSLPLKDLAARTGLGDPSTLWRVFTRRIGVTPAAYRMRFASPGRV
jgi:transcriptional regulator GlxA family with amidase domain